MATYIFGDLQGCYDEFIALLDLINYDESRDQLGFVGDLVNRGPDSLAVLRFIYQCKDPLIVLGNHDCYTLMLGYGVMSRKNYRHTLDDVLAAPDLPSLLDWLRHQPLMLPLPEHGLTIVHAGIAPQWSFGEALDCAHEAEAQLRGADHQEFLKNLFGNEPHRWSSDLAGQDRYRYIINAFTRMRYCNQAGDLDFTADAATPPDKPGYAPWFDFRNQDQQDILFGHWAALRGRCQQPRCFALDTGCVWGHSLTAMRLEDRHIFSVPAKTTSVSH